MRRLYLALAAGHPEVRYEKFWPGCARASLLVTDRGLESRWQLLPIIRTTKPKYILLGHFDICGFLLHSGQAFNPLPRLRS